MRHDPDHAERAAVDLAVFLGRPVRVERDPGEVLMAGVAAAAAEHLLAVGERGPYEQGLGGPPAVQLTQPPGVALRQRPGRRVGPQQLQIGPVPFMGDRHPALDHIGVVAHAVVEGEPEPVHGVRETQPQLVAVRRGVGEGPLGAAHLGRADGERGTDEPGAALDGVLLVPVERGLERPVGRQPPVRERLGVRTGYAWPPVEMEQLVAVREVQCIAARRSGENPRTTLANALDHPDPSDTHRSAQARTSSDADHRSCNASAGSGPR